MRLNGGRKVKLKTKHPYLWICCLCLSLGYLFPIAASAQPCKEWAGKIVSAQGVVEVQKAGQAQWIQVKLNDMICPGDMLRVQRNSRAAIVLTNETLIRLDQNTTVAFKGLDEQQTFLMEMLSGIAHFFSRFPRRLKIKTAFVNASIEGTEFYIRAEPEETFLSVFEGRVLTSNDAGSLALASGQSAIARRAKAPVLRTVVRPRDAVQWALYYLPVIFVSPGKAPAEDMRDPRYLVYRASRLLAVGRVNEAEADIVRALSRDANVSASISSGSGERSASGNRYVGQCRCFQYSVV